jgi:hypothetical protein
MFHQFQVRTCFRPLIPDFADEIIAQHDQADKSATIELVSQNFKSERQHGIIDARVDRVAQPCGHREQGDGHADIAGDAEHGYAT